MIITFSDTRNIARWLERKDYSSFCNYLNSFDGENVFEKFQNIMKCWELDVSNDLGFRSDGKSIKLSLYYLNEIFSEKISQMRELDDGDLKMVLTIPTHFVPADEIFPVYQIIHTLEHTGIVLELYKFDLDERKNIINNLPANFYNKILKSLIKCKDFTISIDNPSINKDFNFLSHDPYYFLEGMFLPYDTVYHRDILYHLSKKLDSNVILTSTLMDIEEYIKEYTKEQETVDKSPAHV